MDSWIASLPAVADATGKGRKSCKNVDILERNDDELDGCGGSGGLGSSGGLGKTGNVSDTQCAGNGWQGESEREDAGDSKK